VKCLHRCEFHCGREAALLNDDPGKIFRDRSAPRDDKRGAKADPSACILIVDPVLGSRFSLAQAVAHPGYVVKAASTVEEEHEILLRGLLAGLNSCEFEAESLELLHTELAIPFRVSEWPQVDEERECGTRIAEDWPVEGDASLAGLSSETLRLLSKARQSLRVTRLDDGSSRTRGEVNRSSCFGLTIRDGGRRTRTCLISADRRRIVPLVSMVRELQSGLQMVFRRIRLAVARAGAARRLAQHVSEKLRTPVRALTHAIDRLRSEARWDADRVGRSLVVRV